MMHPCLQRRSGLAILGLLLVLAGPRAHAGSRTEDLALRSGLHGGLCVMPRAAAAPALELARDGRWIVLACAGDGATAAALRADGLAAGVLARSLYVEEAAAGTLPAADGMADAVWVDGLTDADLTAARRDEWLRVLAPGRGALVAGRGDAGGTLSRAALATWIAAIPGGRVEGEGQALWAVARRPLPAGSEAWTHRAHAADNNLASRDTTIRMPLMTAWYGLPLHYGFWGGTVVAGNGRLYPLMEGRSGGATTLMARSLANGLILWQRTYAAQKPIGRYRSSLHAGRSSMAVDGDTLWLIDGDGVVKLDGETGRQLARVAGPKTGGQVKWFAVTGGAVAILAGEPDDAFTVVHNALTTKPFGRELAAYSAADGNLLWQRAEEGNVDERTIALLGGRLFYHVTGQGTFCRKLDDGSEVWVNRNPELVAMIDAESVTGEGLNQTLGCNAAMLVNSNGLFIGQSWRTNAVVLNPATGSLRWSRAARTLTSGRTLSAMLLGDTLYTARGAFSLATGDPAGRVSLPRDGCGVAAAVNGMFVGCFSTISDIGTGKTLRYNDVKSQCDIGSIIAEGHIVNPGIECRCGVKVMGYRTLVSAPEGFDPHAASLRGAREYACADLAPSAALDVAALDWPTHAHDAARSGASPASVGGEPALAWRYRPDGASTSLPPVLATARGPVFVPTAPVAAGPLACYGDASGVVRVVGVGDGRERWAFPTGGKLFAPPTLWNGRVFAGGGDGFVYALDASSGRLLWRFRAAPMPWKMTWYGHLVSMWPLTGGVIVHDGVLYASAGYQDNNGVHVYALDPANGRTIWERHDAGRGVDGVAGTASSMGAIAVGGGRLWIASVTAGPASFDLKTGEPLLIPGGEGTLWGKALKRGTVLSVANDAWVLQGGRRLSALQEFPAAGEKSEGLIAWPVEALRRAAASRDAGATGLEFGGEGFACMPAHDRDMLLAANRGQLVAFAWTNLQAAAEARLAATPAGKLRFASASILADSRTSPLPGGALWGPLADVAVNAVALTADAALCAGNANARSGAGPFSLRAIDRRSGAVRWAVPLPTCPVADGLCVARDGRVLVSLVDGSLACYAAPAAARAADIR